MEHLQYTFPPYCIFTISLAVCYYAKPEIIMKVPASCFMPRPNVDSAVIRLTRYEKPLVEAVIRQFCKLFQSQRFSAYRRRKAHLRDNLRDFFLTDPQISRIGKPI